MEQHPPDGKPTVEDGDGRILDLVRRERAKSMKG